MAMPVGQVDPNDHRTSVISDDDQMTEVMTPIDRIRDNGEALDLDEGASCRTLATTTPHIPSTTRPTESGGEWQGPSVSLGPSG